MFGFGRPGHEIDKKLSCWQKPNVWVRKCIRRCDPRRFFFHNVLWKRVDPVMSTNCPPFLIYSRHYLAFKLEEAVKHMISSFSFMHIATKIKKKDWHGFIFFDFQIMTPVLIILYACLYSNTMICVDKPIESMETQFICQLSHIFVWYLTVVQTPFLCIQTIF